MDTLNFSLIFFGFVSHDGAGDGNAAALVAVALDALGLAGAAVAAGLDDALHGGRGGAAGPVAVDERRVGGGSAGHSGIDDGGGSLFYIFSK